MRKGFCVMGEVDMSNPILQNFLNIQVIFLAIGSSDAVKFFF